MIRTSIAITFVLCALDTVVSQVPPADTSTADEMLATYFEAETMALQEQCLAAVVSRDAWNAEREEYRRQLLEMLGLDPLPKKTDLSATVTKVVDHPEFTVKCLHYQSRPGLYVTANLYVPKKLDQPLPAILYVCGHGRVRIDGVDYGNKVHYQHHPAWFARNGYVCLTIDTLQLGEIEGVHHGTYRENMWWWMNRGYTPAGVEAWNCVRAIDYLQSLDEVDGDRIGVTGRSGGGAYSWWIAAIDDRIKCAVPVAGITDLENHVVDGCVEGHCDCMFMVNTYRWDYPLLAALVAPRPLLISNTDSDRIFPLDGVYRTYTKVKQVYTSLGVKDNVALHITAGPHKDTQELRVHAFRWFNKHLKGDAESSVLPAEKYFTPQQLRVFDAIPSDERNTEIQEHFVAPATPKAPNSLHVWHEQQKEWKNVLNEKVFRGWPGTECFLNTSEAYKATVDGLVLQAIDFDSQRHVRLRLLVTRAAAKRLSSIRFYALDDAGWQETIKMLSPAFGVQLHSDEGDQAAFQKWAQDIRQTGAVCVYLAPRGAGQTRWDPSPKKQTHNRRRFYLLGQTLDGMRVYDIRRGIQAARTQISGELPITLYARGTMAGISLYAALYESDVSTLVLNQLPPSHRDGPTFLNVRRFFDIPQALAMALTTRQITIVGEPAGFEYAQSVADLVGSSTALRFEAAE